eukprot:gene12249-16337_t
MRYLSPAILAVAVWTGAAGEAPAEGAAAYVWNTYTDTSIAFGVPDTDDRALRIDCEGGKTLVLITPVDPDSAGSDGLVRIVASTDAGMDMLEGGLIELGDGINVSAPLPRPSDALTGLMAGGDLTLMLLGEERVIPGPAAADAMRNAASSASIDAYLDGVPQGQRAALQALRETILDVAPTAVEGISYG